MEILKTVPGELLLKVAGCGVCGTDVHLAAGEIPLARPPVVSRREIAAEVHEVGESGGGFEEGKPVAVDPVIGCGQCKWCRQGQANLRVSPTVLGYVRSGGFCQFLSAPARQVYPVPSSLGTEGDILVETLACVLHGYDRLDVRPGNSILIVGAGTVGLLWVRLIKHSLVTLTVQTDLVEGRAEAAKRLGADIAGNVGRTSLSDLLREHGIGDFDIITDATGDPKAVAGALPYLGRGRKSMIFGVCPEDGCVEISPYEVFLQEQTLLSAKMPPRTFDQAISQIEAGVIDCQALVNRGLPLAQAGDALRMFVEEKDKGIKMMVNPWL